VAPVFERGAPAQGHAFPIPIRARAKGASAKRYKMNTPYNPQATAEQARNAYRDVTAQLGLVGLDTAIPDSVRSVAEKTVAQSREVYDRSTDALEASIETFEKSFDAAGQCATAFNRKIVDLARRNLNSVFDLAKSLASAKDLTEIVELQAAHWQKQFAVLTAQAEEVRALSSKVTSAAAEPIKAHVTNGMDELRNAR
jgi:phasin